MNKTRSILERYWSEVNQLLERVDDKQKLRQHIARIKYNLKKDAPIKSWFEVEKRVSYLNTNESMYTFHFLVSSALYT